MASSQEAVVIGASRSTIVLKPTTETSRIEAANGQAAFSLETPVVELGVASTSNNEIVDVDGPPRNSR